MSGGYAMNRPEKVLLVRLLKNLSENADGEIFIAELMPYKEDREKIHKTLCEKYGWDPEVRRDEGLDEFDEQTLLEYLAERLEEEL
jgi:hypothetical protein